MRPDMPNMGTYYNAEMCPDGHLAHYALCGHKDGMPQNNISAFRKQAGLSQSELAERIGTTLNMMGKLERGERTLDQAWLLKIGQALDIPSHKLIQTELEASDLVVPKPRPISISDSVVTLRMFDLSFAMGPGTNIDDYVEEGTYEFDAHMLSKLTRAPADRLFVARGDGDSMFPTLMNDDMLVIDTTQNVLNMQDRIWACSLYGAGAIKRLRSSQGGKVLVKSDNTAIDDQEVDGSDLHIVGRVIWMGRRI